jgi:hypothetical protein
VRLIMWRDAASLDSHQTRVLDNAIAYAGALRRWLTAPPRGVRHAAAVKAWRRWTGDDPGLIDP